MLFYDVRLTWVWDAQTGLRLAGALRMELSTARLCEGRCFEVQANWTEDAPIYFDFHALLGLDSWPAVAPEPIFLLAEDESQASNPEVGRSASVASWAFDFAPANCPAGHSLEGDRQKAKAPALALPGCLDFLTFDSAFANCPMAHSCAVDM